MGIFNEKREAALHVFLRLAGSPKGRRSQRYSWQDPPVSMNDHANTPRLIEAIDPAFSIGRPDHRSALHAIVKASLVYRYPK